MAGAEGAGVYAAVLDGHNPGIRLEAGRVLVLKFSDGRIADSGEVLEIDPPRRLVLKWRHELFPELTGEGYSRMTYDLEPHGETVKFTVTHTMDKAESKFIEAVSGGWPIILSSLKSLLETGQSIVETREPPKGL